ATPGPAPYLSRAWFAAGRVIRFSARPANTTRSCSRRRHDERESREAVRGALLERRRSSLRDARRRGGEEEAFVHRLPRASAQRRGGVAEREKPADADPASHVPVGQDPRAVRLRGGSWGAEGAATRARRACLRRAARERHPVGSERYREDALGDRSWRASGGARLQSTLHHGGGLGPAARKG